MAVATTAIAVPISMLYFGGATGRGLEGLYGAFSTWSGLGLWTAVAGVNLVVSIIDKVLTGAIAFGLARLVRPVFGTAPARRFIASE